MAPVLGCYGMHGAGVAGNFGPIANDGHLQVFDIEDALAGQTDHEPIPFNFETASADLPHSADTPATYIVNGHSDAKSLHGTALYLIAYSSVINEQSTAAFASLSVCSSETVQGVLTISVVNHPSHQGESPHIPRR